MGQEENVLKSLWKEGLPKVLRGLPRLYKWQETSISKVKSHFDDMEVLKKRYTEKIALKKFSGKMPPKGAHVVLFTWVMEDGWGDYYTQLDAATILQEAFPGIQLTLITLIHKNKSPPEEKNRFTHHVFKYTGKARNEIIYEEFGEEVYALIKNASLLLQLPTFFPHTLSLLEKVENQPRHELIGECGFIDSAWFHPKNGAHCMGLHFLEKGIIIKKMPASPLKPCFNLDYTKTKRGNYVFLHILLKALEHDTRDITIATPSLQLYITRLENGLKDILKRFGIRELVIHFEQSICPITVNTTGKKLIVHHVNQKPHQKFLNDVVATDQLVGCTGDGSISEALSAGKPFFYDPPLHKRNFLKDLIALAEDRLHDYPETIAFLKLSLKNEHLILEDVVDGFVSEEFLLIEKEKTSPEDLRDEVIAEKMGALLQQVKTQKGFKALAAIIQEEYAINETLCHITARAFDTLIL
ncbi:MAG: hypothetical protein V4494_00560 [Chlamydiota bacterium]